MQLFVAAAVAGEDRTHVASGEQPEESPRPSGVAQSRSKFDMEIKPAVHEGHHNGDGTAISLKPSWKPSSTFSSLSTIG